MDALEMDNPFVGTNFAEWLGGLTVGAGAAYAAYKRWTRSEHAEERREGAEDRRDAAEGKVDDIYAVVIKTMQVQIQALTNDNVAIREHLKVCEAQHVACREEHATDRLAMDGMRLRIEELERERDR